MLEAKILNMIETLKKVLGMIGDMLYSMNLYYRTSLTSSRVHGNYRSCENQINQCYQKLRIKYFI